MILIHLAVGVTKTKHIRLLFLRGKYRTQGREFHAVAMTVGDEKLHATQSQGHIFCAVDSVITVSRDAIERFCTQSLSEFLCIPIVISQMKDAIRRKLGNRALHGLHIGVGIREHQYFHNNRLAFRIDWCTREKGERYMSENQNFAAYESEIRRVLGSKEGRALLKLLQQDGGATLRKAAVAFQSGDTASAQALIAPLMENEQAQALVKELNKHG